MFKALERVFDYLVEAVCTERGYGGLFKAGVALVALSLIAVGDAGTFLYERDIDAHRSKFTVEAVSGRALNDTECGALGDLQSECRMAKHQMRTLYSSIELFSKIVEMSFWLGIALLCLSVLGFVASPFSGRKVPEAHSENA